MNVNAIRDCIVNYQQTHHVPDWEMCEVLNMSEGQWQQYKNGHTFALTIYQQIMFMAFAETALPD